MFIWAMVFLTISLVCALLGFGALYGATATIFRIVFAVFLAAFVLALIF